MQDRWRVQRVPRAEPEMAMEMWFIFSSVLLLQRLDLLRGLLQDLVSDGFVVVL